MSRVKQVLVVGGGTSGWLSAAILAKKLNANSSQGIKVVLVESPNIPTIGVGEGTFPTMLETLKFIGIDENTFIKSCNATFKQGIKFVDWLYAPKNGQHTHYYHLFNAPENASGVDLAPSWLAMDPETRPHYAEAVSVQAEICDAGLAPKHITTPPYKWLSKYAYHLDAGNFVDLLKTHSVEKLGVVHHRATVSEVIKDEEGYIQSVMTEELGELSADLFIDCTGFSSLLMGKALGVPFHNKNDVLFVDHAVAMQVPYGQSDHPIASQTISTAHEAGWTWDIGLRTRRGIGYVYSSKYTSHDQAEALLRNYVGPQSEKLDARRLKMQVGYRDKFWEKNCVAIGFSGAFMEPLEATAIAMVEAGAFMLAHQFPSEKRAIESVAKKYNEVFRYRWDRIIDFIKLHYCLSRRTDNDFWIDNTKDETIPDSLLEKIELWKSFPPQVNDFPNAFAMFGLASYQYILYGLDFKIQAVEDFVTSKHGNIIQQRFEAVRKQVENALKHLPKHRDLVEQVYTNGFKA